MPSTVADGQRVPLTAVDGGATRKADPAVLFREHGDVMKFYTESSVTIPTTGI